MADYLYLFRGGDARMAELSQEESQAHLAKWTAWMGRLGQAGKLQGGRPLGPGGSVVAKSGAQITDGPFSEGSEIVGGYVIVIADSHEEAVEMSKECPIFELGGTAEVREILEI